MKRAVRPLVLLVVLVLAALAIASQWGQVRPALASMALLPVVAALGVGVLAVLCALPAWQALLTELGSPLPLRDGAGVFLTGQLGKFVPGSVWVVVAQADLGRRHGVPRTRSAVVGLLAMGVSLATAVVTAAAFLPLADARARHDYGWVALLALLALVGLAPPVLTPVVQRGLRLLRRPPLEQPLSWRAVALAALWSLAGWVLYGVHLWLLATALPGSSPLSLLPRSVGAFALAWTVGFLVVVAPAGAGVREVVLTAALSSVLVRGGPLAIALVSRLELTVVDVGLGLGAVVVGRWRRR